MKYSKDIEGSTISTITNRINESPLSQIRITKSITHSDIQQKGHASAKSVVSQHGKFIRSGVQIIVSGNIHSLLLYPTFRPLWLYGYHRSLEGEDFHFVT